MVINENSEIPFEVPNHMDSTKYIVVKNHVRELSLDHESNEKSCSTNTIPQNHKKSAKKRKQTIDHSPEEINENFTEDLEELRTTYRKCKAVLAKIESKYGHLLNLEHEEDCSNKKIIYSEDYQEDCNCVFNKKIVFDEDGKQIQDITQEHLSTTHICPNRLQIKEHYQICQNNVNVTIEEDNFSETLPNNVIELLEILKKSDINNTFRKNVIEKLRYIRHQNSDMIKFDKSNLIKQVKINPNEVFSFKGTNLSTLQGYPEPKS